jgi:hypothetical protein
MAVEPEVSAQIRTNNSDKEILRNFHPIFILKTCLPKIHLTDILPYPSQFLKYTISEKFAQNNSACIHFLSHAKDMPSLQQQENKSLRTHDNSTAARYYRSPD